MATMTSSMAFCKASRLVACVSEKTFTATGLLLLPRASRTSPKEPLPNRRPVSTYRSS